MIQQTALSCAL